MVPARFVLLGLGAALLIGSGLAYFALGAPKPIAIFAASVGVALIAWSHALHVLRK